MRIDILGRKDFLASATVFLLKGFSGFLQFVLNVVVARSLGVEDSGVFYLALAITMFCATLGRFGLENVLLRHVSCFFEQKRWGELGAVFFRCIFMCLFVSIFVSISVYILAPWLTKNVFHKDGLADTLRVLIFIVGPYSLFWLVGEAFKGVLRAGESQIVQGVLFPLFIIIAICFVDVSGSVVNISIIFLVSSIFVLCLSLFRFICSFPKIVKTRGGLTYSDILKSSPHFLAAQVFFVYMQWMPIIFLGFWGSDRDVGLLSLAVRTALIVNLVLASVNSVVAPKFSFLFAGGDFRSLESLAKKTTWMMILIATPMLFIIVVFSKYVMSFYGRGFVGGGILLAILAVGQFFNVATGSVGYLLSMTGNESSLKNSFLFSVVFSTLLAFILIKPYGAVGAAFVSSIGVIVQNLIAFYCVKKKIGFFTIGMP